MVVLLQFLNPQARQVGIVGVLKARKECFERGNGSDEYGLGLWTYKQ